MNDQEIVQCLVQMKQGDEEAFRNIYALTCHDVLRTITWLVHANDVQDVMHEVYIQIWKSADQYDAQQRPFSFWVKGLVLRQISNYKRKGWQGFRLFEKQTLLIRKEDLLSSPA